MNIFYLHHQWSTCARWHMDKHVVKMILEYTQILSTSTRMLDGVLIKKSVGSRYDQYILSDPILNETIYKATHTTHPCVLWAMKSSENYSWLLGLTRALIVEFERRYDKKHKCEKILNILEKLPKNIPVGAFTTPALAMPDEYKVLDDAQQSYHNYYIYGKQHLSSWKRSVAPTWYIFFLSNK